MADWQPFNHTGTSGTPGMCRRNPDEYTVLQLANLVLEITGSASTITFEPLPQDDPRQRMPDISLARRLLDWEPRVPVGDGLRRTIEAMREAGW